MPAVTAHCWTWHREPPVRSRYELMCRAREALVSFVGVRELQPRA